mgnify:FL=1
MAFPVAVKKKKTKRKPKDLGEVAMGRQKKKNPAYLAEEIHMTEYAWVGDHPIGPIPEEKKEEEEEEEESQEGNFTMGQSGG